MMPFTIKGIMVYDFIGRGGKINENSKLLLD